jgi:hypothetical protein
MRTLCTDLSMTRNRVFEVRFASCDKRIFKPSKPGATGRGNCTLCKFE